LEPAPKIRRGRSVFGSNGPERSTRFSKNEQYALMSLWSIARSPLMFGGNLPQSDDFTLSLLTNDEVIGINQNSDHNRVLFDHEGLIAWTAEVPGSQGKYLAFFNTREEHVIAENHRSPQGPSTSESPGDNETLRKVSVSLSDLGCAGTCMIRDLWHKKDVGEFTREFVTEIQWHGGALYRVTPKRP